MTGVPVVVCLFVSRRVFSTPSYESHVVVVVVVVVGGYDGARTTVVGRSSRNCPDGEAGAGAAAAAAAEAVLLRWCVVARWEVLGQ